MLWFRLYFTNWATVSLTSFIRIWVSSSAHCLCFKVELQNLCFMLFTSVLMLPVVQKQTKTITASAGYGTRIRKAKAVAFWAPCVFQFHQSCISISTTLTLYHIFFNLSRTFLFFIWGFIVYTPTTLAFSGLARWKPYKLTNILLCILRLNHAQTINWVETQGLEPNGSEPHRQRKRIPAPSIQHGSCLM